MDRYRAPQNVPGSQGIHSGFCRSVLPDHLSCRVPILLARRSDGDPAMVFREKTSGSADVQLRIFQLGRVFHQIHRSAAKTVATGPDHRTYSRCKKGRIWLFPPQRPYDIRPIIVRYYGMVLPRQRIVYCFHRPVHTDPVRQNVSGGPHAARYHCCGYRYRSGMPGQLQDPEVVLRK